MVDRLNVYWSTHIVGHLWLDEKRNFVFQYDKEWLSYADAIPLSTRLPLRSDAFSHDLSSAFFTNILPEGKIRYVIARSRGFSEKNDFKLLEELGGDCAGAISLLTEDEKPAASGDYEPLTDAELSKMIANVVQRPLIASKDGLRLSLAGAQDKLPVRIDENGKLFIPHGSYSSTHILKPNIPNIPNSVENEAFCMVFAKECGLNVPEVQIKKGTPPVYIVQRYDRSVQNDSITRLHQEDFCQALGFNDDQKYQSEGGPGLRDCFLLVAEYCSNPLVDKQQLLRWVIFNFLIGNCDAHAKNLSLLIQKSGEVHLAPFYDLLSTIVYKGLSRKMAMKIGGENRLAHILKRHWERFAEEADVKPKGVLDLCREMAELAAERSNRLLKSFSDEHGEIQAINDICTRIARTGKALLEL